MKPSGSFAIHRLNGADIPLLKALLRVFGEAFDEMETYQRAVPTDAYLMQLLSRDHFIAIVATTPEEVVGGLAAYVLDKFEQQRREIYIYDLAVAKDHRRRGIATGLIEALRRVAAELGAYVIFVQADLTDAPAISLYESLGAKETAYHFDIGVPDKCMTPSDGA